MLHHVAPNIGVFDPFGLMAKKKNNVNKVHRWFFRYVSFGPFHSMPNQKTMQTGFLAPKRPNLARNWHFWSTWARPFSLFNALLWVGWWLWRAGCITQDTYLLHDIIITFRKNKSDILDRSARGSNRIF